FGGTLATARPRQSGRIVQAKKCLARALVSPPMPRQSISASWKRPNSAVRSAYAPSVRRSIVTIDAPGAMDTTNSRAGGRRLSGMWTAKAKTVKTRRGDDVSSGRRERRTSRIDARVRGSEATAHAHARPTAKKVCRDLRARTRLVPAAEEQI